MISLSNRNSHLTAIRRNRLSYPARKLKELSLLNGRILDFGSGYGEDSEFLHQQGFEITAFDPYYHPVISKGCFDTICCFYVLNVLEKKAQSEVIWKVSQLLNPLGKAYFAVRRDLKKEGYRFHHIHQVKTYQCNVILPFCSVHRAAHCEIYQFQRFSELHQPRFDKAMGKNYSFYGETACTVALKINPYARETFLFPKRSVKSFRELNSHEQKAMQWVRDHLCAEVVGEKKKDFAWILSPL